MSSSYRKKQIIVIVTDKASNMIKTVEKLNTSEDSAFGEGASTNLEDQHEELETLDEYDDQDLNTVTEYEANLCHVTHMRCAVHPLQLAIRDGLKGQHVSNLISKLRQVAVAARMTKIDSIIKRTGKGAIVDQATHWGCTYLRIQRLVS